jgi:hypothetical protein
MLMKNVPVRFSSSLFQPAPRTCFRMMLPAFINLPVAAVAFALGVTIWHYRGHMLRGDWRTAGEEGPAHMS